VRKFEYAAAHPYTDDASIKGDTIPISAKVAGRVAKVHVEEHAAVARGQVLLALDPTDSQIRVDQAAAALQAARARVLQARAALDAQEHQSAGALAQAQAGVGVASARRAQSRTAATLQERQLTAEIAQAEAALRTAEAQLVTARAQEAAAAAEEMTAAANAAAAQATLNRANQDYARFRALADQGAVAVQQIEAAKAAYETAQAQLAAARAVQHTATERRRAAHSQVIALQAGVQQARARLELVNANRAQLQMREEDITAAVAQEDQARASLRAAAGGRDLVRVRAADVAAAEAAAAQAAAQLAAARQELRNTVIVAPAQGTVTQISVQPGQLIQIGQPVFVLVPDDRRWVVAHFKETQIERMRVGQPATVRVDALRRTFRGHVLSIGSATGSTFSLLPPENASGNFVKVVQRVPVRIALDEGPQQPLQLGLSVEVEVNTDDATP
jgi:membrane fusion protein (multidrug efflux system)